MNVMSSWAYKKVIRDICALNWAGLSSEELTCAAWAYYHFSIQFRENLTTALRLYPEDEKLAHLSAEECDTDNLSPWPRVAAEGERMNHDEFMRRTLMLGTIGSEQKARLIDLGESYLQATRAESEINRAMSIASYEDGGLESVFRAILLAPAWDGPLLQAFRHFLAEHIRFDSDPDQGHGALSRHMAPDDRVLGLWNQFHTLLIESVPALAKR